MKEFWQVIDGILKESELDIIVLFLSNLDGSFFINLLADVR